jgi:hypothetical protein
MSTGKDKENEKHNYIEQQSKKRRQGRSYDDYPAWKINLFKYRCFALQQHHTV